MIKLRRLIEKDVPLMLEWMHDIEVQKFFRKNMLEITEEQAIIFCKNAEITDKLSQGCSLHYAIVNEQDEYLGTISLKDINIENKTAEYAISMRKCVRGKGVAKKATGILLKIAFEDFGLHRVYLNVFEDNVVARRFYEKCGFVHEGESRKHVYLNGEYKTLEWYGMLKEEYDIQLLER